MDRNTRRNRPENSARDSGRSTRFTDVPRELMDNVARGVASDDPVEAANNLTNLRLASRSVRSDLEGGSAGQFHSRLNRLGESAQRVYSAAMPPPGNALISDPFNSRYCPVGPVLKFQTAAMKSAAVDRILGMTDRTSQSLALSNIADNIGDLSSADRTRILDRTVDLLTQGPNAAEHNVNYVTALKKGQDYLNEGQRERLDAFPLYGMLHDALGEPAGRAGQPQNSDLDRRIDAIEARAQQLPGEWSYYQQNTVAETGEDIHDAYNSARAELMDSDRSRDWTR
ncbi:hypothetical protein O7A70_06355 [Mesorhizobium sp. Cs1299R1N1]|uniref:hypothetical protein n=1 Tax=Mesorhizobium sp. Cs1299R1N1 TaxID=3015172 RepID=UPI00301BED48